METNERGTGNRAREAGPPTGAEVARAVRDDAARLLVRAAWGATALTILVAAGLLAGGCGRGARDRSAAAPEPAPVVAAGQSGTDQVAARVASVAAREPGSQSLAAASADSLPPDVAASVSDSLVFAGASVEITAQGSPDVIAVTLADGTGSRQPFAYDPDADLWRVAYRVPVRPRNDHPALSVTARNASGRWRRVWVFLNVDSTATAR